MIKHFLRGIIDSDGSISGKDKRWKLSVICSKQIAQMCYDFYGKGSITKDKRHKHHGVIFTTCLSSKNIDKMLDMYSFVSLDRKYRKVQEYVNSYCHS